MNHHALTGILCYNMDMSEIQKRLEAAREQSGDSQSPNLFTKPLKSTGIILLILLAVYCILYFFPDLF